MNKNRYLDQNKKIYILTKKYIYQLKQADPLAKISLVVVLVVLLQVLGPVRLVYNRSGSMALGLYVGLKHADDAPAVLVKPPKKAVTLGCTTQYTMLLKHVVARANEQVCLHERTLYVGGKPYSQTPRYGSKGQPIDLAFTGCITIEEGHVFVATPHPKSCDSRLFGPLPLKHIWGGAYPMEKLWQR